MPEIVTKWKGTGMGQAGGTISAGLAAAFVLMLCEKFQLLTFTQTELSIAIPVLGAALNWIWGIRPRFMRVSPVAIVVVGLIGLGCAAQAWPPAVAFGDSSVTKGAMVCVETSEGEHTCSCEGPDCTSIRGGSLSETAGNLLEPISEAIGGAFRIVAGLFGGGA